MPKKVEEIFEIPPLVDEDPDFGGVNNDAIGLIPPMDIVSDRLVSVGAHPEPNSEYNIWASEGREGRYCIKYVIIGASSIVTFILVGVFFWSVGAGYNTPLLDYYDAEWYVAIGIMVLVMKFLVAIFYCFLWSRVIPGDRARKSREQKWPPPPIYAIREIFMLLSYSFALWMAVLAYRNRSNKYESKFYEVAALGGGCIIPLWPYIDPFVKHIIAYIFKPQLN